MSDSFIKRFLDTLQNPPEPSDAPPIIPQRFRIPFFLSLTLVSLFALVLLVRFVVIPSIHTQTVATPPASTSTTGP